MPLVVCPASAGSGVCPAHRRVWAAEDDAKLRGQSWLTARPGHSYLCAGPGRVRIPVCAPDTYTRSPARLHTSTRHPTRRPPRHPDNWRILPRQSPRGG